MDNEIGLVYESSASGIVVHLDISSFEDNKDFIMIGKHLKIDFGNHNFLIAVITNIRAISDDDRENYLLVAEPLGTVEDDKFIPGSSTIPSPTEKVFIPDESTLNHIFQKNDKYSFELGNLVQNPDIPLYLDGDTFFSKHIGVVGSTGSGKSFAVSKILQEIVGIKDGKNINKDSKKNSHIIIFDIHSEYSAAFKVDEEENFTLNYLNVEKMKLPYWLMNSEELESIFIESNEHNSHNQVSQFRKAVIKNKEKYNPDLLKITYDTPVYFNIREVYNYIHNLNNEVINKIEHEEWLPKIIKENGEEELISETNQYFNQIYDFVSTSTAKASRASNGAFNGEFNRFISRLSNKINDKRLDFIMNPLKEDSTPYLTTDFPEILKQFLGYLDKANISIVDLSGVPFEVLSITVSLISRIIFDFAFYYSKLKHLAGSTNDIPFLIVCEEAHNYVPRIDTVNYRASRKSIERIAKEGRKYGLSLMVVSQRPSEVSDTIFAQCNNFLSLRLTNSADQNYIKNLMSNNSGAIADVLPSLSPGECLVVGDATPVPSVVKMKKPNPKPSSENIRVHKVWKEEWKDIDGSDLCNVSIDDVIEKWTGERNVTSL